MFPFTWLTNWVCTWSLLWRGTGGSHLSELGQETARPCCHLSVKGPHCTCVWTFTTKVVVLIWMVEEESFRKFNCMRVAEAWVLSLCSLHPVPVHSLLPDTRYPVSCAPAPDFISMVHCASSYLEKIKPIPTLSFLFSGFFFTTVMRK